MSDQIKPDGLAELQALHDAHEQAARRVSEVRRQLHDFERMEQAARSALTMGRLAATSFAEVPTPDLRERIADMARDYAVTVLSMPGLDWATRDAAWKPFRVALGELAKRAMREAPEPRPIYPGVVGTLVTMGDDAARFHSEEGPHTERYGEAELVIVLSRADVQKLGALGLLRQTVYIGPVPETR